MARAVQIAELNSSSKVTAKFNSGKSKTMYETFVADKVKAKLLKKGDKLTVQVLSGKRGRKVSGSGESPRQQFVGEYFDEMLLDFDNQDDPFVHYRISLLHTHGQDALVALDNQKVESVRKIRIRNNSEKKYKYILDVSPNGLPALCDGRFSLLIDKVIYEKDDVFPNQHFVLDDPYNVKYWKKYNDFWGNFLEIDHRELFELFINNLGSDQPVSVTVGATNFFGLLKLDQDDKVKFVKPIQGLNLLWDKKMASIESRGSATIGPIAVGNMSKQETIELKVNLSTFDAALDVYKKLLQISN